MTAPCPLCGSPAELTDVVIESYDVECPECKKFRITDRALEFLRQNAAKVRNQLPLVSRAAREAEVPILITDAEDVASLAEKQRAEEGAKASG